MELVVSKSPRLRWLRNWFLRANRPSKGAPINRKKSTLCVELLEDRTVPSSAAFGPTGIDAQELWVLLCGGTLDGTGISIGQVEGGRPGMGGANNDPDYNHPNVLPAAVFLMDGAPTPNGGPNGKEITRTESHATNVAGAIIGSGPNAEYHGAAPAAALYSSAVMGDITDQVVLISAQKVILPAEEVKSLAFNMSFGYRGDNRGVDGSYLANLGLDWMAGSSGYESLPVISSGNLNNNGDILSSTYNALVVASTLQNDFGTYDFVDRNASNFQSATVPGSQALRPLISLVAPGNNVLLPQIPLLQNGFQSYAFKSGSSFATPQATGAVALLAQYAQSAVANNVPQWDNDSLKPEVIKAILMNSADKVAGRIGMQKTIYHSNGESWDTGSEARDIPSTLQNQVERDLVNQIRQATPTSPEFGTGQLNVRRALDQYDGGEYHPVAAGNVLPTQAWDFNTLNQQNGEQIYRLPALRQGSYISITLTWNRDVTLQERGTPKRPL
jgi:Subtilase family